MQTYWLLPLFCFVYDMWALSNSARYAETLCKDMGCRKLGNPGVARTRGLFDGIQATHGELIIARQRYQAGGRLQMRFSVSQ